MNDEPTKTGYLKYIGKGQSPWFHPDRIGNFRTNVPDDASLSVIDKNGVPICGRVIPGAQRYYIYLEDYEWVWLPKH